MGGNGGRSATCAALVMLGVACAAPPRSAPSQAAPQASSRATLITNALLIDGTGAAPRRGSVRVIGDRIAAVGNLRPATGDQIVDATGLALAPGFIDTHSHADWHLADHRDALAHVSQGITTAIVGQDGGSWDTLATFFARLERTPGALNVASYVGHNTVRYQVLGDNYKRPATAGEIERMKVLVAEGMRAGALGLSTGLEYDPGIYSTPAEVIAVATEAARRERTADRTTPGARASACGDAVLPSSITLRQIMTATVFFRVLPAAAALLAMPAARAQSSGEAAFVFLMRADTIGIERFRSTPQGMTGEILLQGQPRVTYLATRESPGRVGSLFIVAYPPGSGPDAPALQTARLRLVADTGIAEITTSGTTQTQRLPTKPDAFLLLNSSIGMLELALERMSGASRDSVTFPVLLSAGGQTLSATVRRVSADSAVLTLGPVESHLALRGPRILRMRVPAQALVVERVEGDAVRRLALGRPDYSAPAGAPYRVEHVTIPTPAGHVLAGTMTIPGGASGRTPAVITISGSGPQDRDEYIPLVPGYRPFRQVADTLGRRGIIVLRLDDRGTGESTGNFATSTSADFADDVRAAIAWLRTRPDVDPARIALLGHSEGAMIAPMVGASDPRLAAIVLLAGPSKRGRVIIDHQIRYGVEHDSSIAASKRDSAFAALKLVADTSAAPRPWMKFFLDYDPLPTIRKVKAPVLVLQGATDQQVTADQAEALGEALRQAGNRNVVVRVLPNRNHLFLPDSIGNPAGYVRLPSGKIGPEVMGEIAEWLAARLKTKA